MLSNSELLLPLRDYVYIPDRKLILESARIWGVLKVSHERADIYALTLNTQQKIGTWHIQNQGFSGMNGVWSRFGFTDGKPGISTMGLTGKPLAPWNIEPISPS